MVVSTISISFELKSFGFGHVVSKYSKKFKQEGLRFKNKTLTVSTCGPVWITELVIRKAGECIIVFRVIIGKSVVMFASITFVKDFFIMSWRIFCIPIELKIAFCWGVRRVGTVRP